MREAEFLRLVDAVGTAATHPRSTLHGPAHWQRVAEVGWHLTRGTAARAEVVLCFGLLHDARRLDDGLDAEHGERAAALVERLAADGVLPLDPAARELLRLACARHHHGDVSEDPTIGACFDADRLTLWRAGITPDARFLSTPRGRLPALSALGRDLEEHQPLGWPALWCAYRDDRLPAWRPALA